ncbi:MAG: hypothetical protein KGJ05_08825, partial [Alphaproteobacteria bacterium]|nr:hypothetical protein [Alphaproteobacteria bacterium]
MASAVSAVSAGLVAPRVVMALRLAPMAHLAHQVANGTSALGGLAGYEADTAITLSYWNITTSRQTSLCGATSGPICTSANGLTTAQMMQASSFSGWNNALDTTGAQGKSAPWRIYNGFTDPLLKAFMTPATVTGSLANAAVTYNSSDQAGAAGAATPYSVMLAGNVAANPALISGTAALACSGGDASCTNVGSYNVAIGGLYSGQLGYDLISGTGTSAALTITPATLTITGAITNTTYNGTAQSNHFSVSGLLGSDSVTGVSGIATGTNAGSYADTLAAATGTGLSNYNIMYSNGALNIGRATLTLTGANTSVTYNGVAQTNTGASYSGQQGSDSFTISGYASGTNAGSYADALALTGTGGTLLSNYNVLTTNGALTITPAPLTITYTATPATSIYGAALA